MARNRKLIIAIAVLFPTVVTWVYFVALDSHSDVIKKVAYGIGKTLQFATPILWVYLFHRNQIQHKRPQRAEIMIGLVSGLVIAAAMWLLFDLVIANSSVYSELEQKVQHKVAGFNFTSIPAYLGMAVFYAAFHSLLEEYYWRWFVFGQLKEVTSLSVAMAISSLGFMAHHVIVLAYFFGSDSPLAYVFSFCIAIGGAFWAWMYHRFGTLYGVWTSHAIVDAGIFFIGFQMLKSLL